jgi:hypothetical protein
VPIRAERVSPTAETSTRLIKDFRGAGIPDHTVPIMMLSRVEPPTHRTESATGVCVRKLFSRLRFNQEHQRITWRLMPRSNLPYLRDPPPNPFKYTRSSQSITLSVSYVSRARDRQTWPGHRLRVLLAHGTYWQDRTRSSQPASLIPHTTPADSEPFVRRTRDLSLQHLRLKVLQAYRSHGYHSRKFTSILLFCAGLFLKTIGLPWPLGSGKRLWYVTVKQKYRTRTLIPMGIEDWDQLLPTSRPRPRVTTLH